MSVRRGVVIAISSVLVSGCSMVRTDLRSAIGDYRANTAEIKLADVKPFVDNQNQVMTEFIAMAGVNPPREGTEWRQVVDSGIYYINVRCDRFISSLFLFDRIRSTTSRQINYTGASVSSALAVLEASKAAIGLTPLGFAFVDQTVNNLGSGLLFNLKPATVRTLIKKQQDAYLKGLSESYTSKAIAFQEIQRYAEICLPFSIEAEVDRAIAAREFQPDQILSAAAPNLSDSTPDSFNFSSNTSANAGEEIESDPVTLTGFGRETPVFVANGQYRIDNGPWTANRGTVGPGRTIAVKGNSSSTPGGTVTVRLTVGGVSGVFNITTKPATPSAAELAPVNAPPVEINATTNALSSPRAGN